MEYSEIDYINKMPKENLDYLIDQISIELVKKNPILFERVLQIAMKHIEIMILDTHETDKKRDVYFILEPTWRAIKQELEKIIKS
jgi:hypothetical protein